MKARALPVFGERSEFRMEKLAGDWGGGQGTWSGESGQRSGSEMRPKRRPVR